MDNYKYQPLAGLLSIKKEQISNANIFVAISMVEEIVNSSPKGSATQLALLFYLIHVLNESGLEFYVKGGVIASYYLKDNARPTYDLDIIISEDVGSFYQKLENVISSLDGFKIINYKKAAADEIYYYDAFSIELDAKGIKIGIDGIYHPLIYKEIKYQVYKGPEFITSDFNFKGVPIEYVLAEKIMAITNELERPYKHLVDVYSLIHIKLDMALLKKYLNLIIESDNQVRKKLNKEAKDYIYIIKDDKEFVGSYIFSALQAGYNITFEEMKNTVNNWLLSIG